MEAIANQNTTTSGVAVVDELAQAVRANLKPKYPNYKVNVTDVFVLPEPIVKQGDRTIASRGNLVIYIGKPKAFKTFLTSATCAGSMEDDTLSMSGSAEKCLYIDTEQSAAHVNIVHKRIYRLCGWDLSSSNDRLTMLALRELDAGNRLEITLEAIDDTNADLVIIDGVRDLVKDFNDITESSKVVGLLMEASSRKKCAIICVLHQNKNDNNARGHLGTELCNKSETVLQVENTNGIATVKPIYSRNREIAEFSFRINEFGLPIGCDLPKVEIKTEELKELMRKAMFGSSWMSRKDLTAKIAILTGKTERTAERKIKDALDKEILSVNKVGYLILSDQAIPEKSEPMPF